MPQVYTIRRRAPGWTMLEMVIAVGILVILASLLVPYASSMRAKAKKIQCAGNLRLLHQALTMYSIDNSRQFEMYPAYLTNLYLVSEGSSPVNGSYVSDPRAFICPMDDTKATKNVYGVTSLKPIFSVSPPIPKDNKSDWAERIQYGNGMQNCSYLYEFSGRTCQMYSPDDFGGVWNSDSPSSFAEVYLVAAEDPFFYTTPFEVARDPIKVSDELLAVTWQDAKFFQLAYGDIYRCGIEDSSFGDFPDPPAGFMDPSDWYWENDVAEEDYLRSYPRTWFPIIRCFWHQTLLHVDSESYEEVQNMSLSGNVFNSAPYWERTAFKYGARVGGDTVGPPQPVEIEE